MPATLSYADHPPAPGLARHVVSYWSLHVPPGQGEATHSVPPDGCTHVGFQRGFVVVIGPHVRPLRPPLVPGTDWFGIRFRPGAARLFFRSTRLPRLRNAVLRRDAIAGEAWLMALANSLSAEAGDDAQCAVANAHLERLRPEVGEVSDLVQRTVEALLVSGGCVRVSELAREAGLSERQLRRVFTAAVDLSPKEFASAWRLRLCALRSLESSPDWAATAAELGFADQAHLTREFTRWIGLTPRGLTRQSAQIRHDRLEWPSLRDRSQT